MQKEFLPTSLRPVKVMPLLEVEIPTDDDELLDLIQSTSQVHRNLDDEVKREEEKPNNRETVIRLKKRKLRYKERLTNLEAVLTARGGVPMVQG